jgi:RNA recognition motif-containing protein
VPFEAQESDLWPVFNELGTIQELVILKNPQGRSKGCAFLTYESRASAEAAIDQINGKVCSKIAQA